MVDLDESYEPEGTEEEAFDGKTKSSKRLLDAIQEAERAFQTWQRICDRVDRLYSNLSGFTDRGSTDFSDREFSLFWATVEVIKPSIYSRPPIPVVDTRFKDRDPVKRTAAELLERCAVSGFDLTDIDQVMLDIRDDLAICSRGVPWVTYEDAKESPTETERVCIEHLDREDFLHEPARKWAEVGWVARRAWLSKREMRKRFYKHSGAAYQNATYATRREDQRNGGADKSLKCGVWEIWSRTEKKVYWVTENVDACLDVSEPYLKLSRFFPCPRPAYGTVQRRTLIPVPDVTYYEGQLEQINELTMRIHGLVDSLRVKGLYPSGGDVGDAVEMALKMEDDAKVLVPVNAAVLGQVAMKDMIVWLPIDQIASTIQACVLTRTQLIEDVYQIVGTADIMRGATDPNETAKAQTLKAQFGAVRIRDKVAELVRVARDTVRIMVEIMAEEFSRDTLVDMSQMNLPTDAEIKKRIKEMQDAAGKEMEMFSAQVEAELQNPEMAQQAQENPQAANQKLQQGLNQIKAKYSGMIEQTASEPTVEQVLSLIQDEKTRPFDFDIETDSTVYPDEQAEKASRNEFMMAFSSAAAALAPLAQQGKEGAQLAGEMLKFQLGAYRASRQVDNAVDEWIKSIQNNPQPADPEADKNAAEAEAKKGELEMKGREIALREQELQLKAQEMQMAPQIAAQVEQIKAQATLQARQADAQVAITREQAQLDADMETKRLDLEASAALAAQQAEFNREKLMLDEAFRRDELAMKERLETMKLAASRASAQEAAAAKANAGNAP